MSVAQLADLPATVLRLVEMHVGHVNKAETVAAGSVRDLAATLYSETGVIFCKGIRADAPLAWTFRNEAEVNPFLPRALVPALRFSFEAEGWLLVGFDHVPGHSPDLSPGSPDLARVAATMSLLATELTPCPAIVQPFTKRWSGLIDATLIDGDTLLHTDVTPHNFLMAGDTVSVIDWSMPSRGAAWIDTALMVVRLIRAGHDPSEAERWAEYIDCWTSAPTDAVSGFSRAYAALTARRSVEAPAPHRTELAQAAARWANARRAGSAETSMV